VWQRSRGGVHAPSASFEPPSSSLEARTRGVAARRPARRAGRATRAPAHGSLQVMVAMAYCDSTCGAGRRQSAQGAALRSAACCVRALCLPAACARRPGTSAPRGRSHRRVEARLLEHPAAVRQCCRAAVRAERGFSRRRAQSAALRKSAARLSLASSCAVLRTSAITFSSIAGRRGRERVSATARGAEARLCTCASSRLAPRCASCVASSVANSIVDTSASSSMAYALACATLKKDTVRPRPARRVAQLHAAQVVQLAVMGARGAGAGVVRAEVA
jgi:hypothetical protein